MSVDQERERTRAELEAQRDEIIHQNNMEKEDMICDFTRIKEELQDSLNAVQRDRDEQLLIAENDKQQVQINPEYFLLGLHVPLW